MQAQKKRQAVFMLCGNCFWTASAIDRQGYELAFCPSCMQNRLLSMPVAPDYSNSLSERASLEVCSAQ